MPLRAKLNKIKCALICSLVHVLFTKHPVNYLGQNGFLIQRVLERPTMNAGTVYILDDEPSIREAYRLTLSSQGYEAILFERLSALKDYFENHASVPQRSCLLLDMRLADEHGLEAQEWLITKGIDVPIIFISGKSTPEEIISAMRAGAIDFLLKPVARERLLQIVENTLIRFDAQIMPPGFENLTRREIQVLELATQGLRSHQIAEALGIAVRTVKMHRTNLMTKANVKSAVQLVALYQERRLSKKMAGR